MGIQVSAPRVSRHPGGRPRKGQTRINDVLGRFQTALENRQVKLTSRKWYADRLKPFIAFCGIQDVYTVGALTEELAGAYLRHLRETPGQKGKLVSEHTILDNYNVAKIFCAWLVSTHQLGRNPFGEIKRPKVVEDQVALVSEADGQKLMEGAKALGGFRGIRMEAILGFTVGTHARLSEVRKVEVDDVDWEGNQVRVRGKGNKERWVGFGLPVRSLLLRYVRARSDYLESHRWEDPGALFITEDGQAFTRSGFSSLYRRFRKKMGTKGRFHGLRHLSAALWVAQHGSDPFVLKDRLGHTTMEMTLKYVRLFGSHKREQARKYDPLGRLMGD